MRESSEKGFGILEQARFVTELNRVHGMEVAEIADTLSRSRSWVFMRLELAGEMSETVREKVFGGAFPVYSYMYTLRPFLRKKGVSKSDGDAFVKAVSGKRLSIREIEQLAHGYFRASGCRDRRGHLLVSRCGGARDADVVDDSNGVSWRISDPLEVCRVMEGRARGVDINVLVQANLPWDPSGSAP
jgi:hypothetical protein